ncbi:MAG: hypothetical protein V4736_05200 [Bdellovibrionota bacterium]
MNRLVTLWPGFILVICAALAACGPVKFGQNKFTSNVGTSSSTTMPPVGGTTTTTGLGTRDVTFQTVVSTNNRLDMLLIIDDSNSMLQDNKKLAERLAPFVNSLAGSSIDWQMCVTVTRALPVSGVQTWGASIVWSNYTPTTGVPRWVLRPGGGDLNTIFTTTVNNIGAGWANTDDERGIKSTWWHLNYGDTRSGNNSGCHRSDAAFAAIVISDEDERSVGGIATDQYYAGEYKPLENDDLPATVVKQVKDIFGTAKRFSFNSIIVRPNDTTCYASQDAQGSKSHYGRKYAELSGLTGGGIGSICDADYSTNLNYFKGQIQDSIASFNLECAPVGNNVIATVTPPVAGLTQEIQGQTISFTPTIPTGRTLKLQYKCGI